jgi:hypothetical protein
MNFGPIEYDNPMYRARVGRAIEKSAADLINQGRKLAREAREEARIESLLAAEYGPRVKPDRN